MNVNRWFLTCINQPQFKAVLGEVEICTKMATFDGEGKTCLFFKAISCLNHISIFSAKKYNQLFPSKKEKASKKKEDKPAAEKKESKPKAKPKDEEPEDDEPKPPKFKDPYVGLPKR